MDSISERSGEQKPVVDKGHGTKALGPSDSSDSGSDIQGGPGLEQEMRRGGGLGLDRGTTSDVDIDAEPSDAGPDVGDANLDSDSDAAGTGERATAGRDAPFREANDIYPDHIETIAPAAGIADIDSDEADSRADKSQERTGPKAGASRRPHRT